MLARDIISVCGGRGKMKGGRERRGPMNYMFVLFLFGTLNT